MCGQQKRNIIRTSSTAYEQDHSAAAHRLRAAARADPMFAEVGTIFPTCWMSRVGPKLQSIVCVGRRTPPRTTPTRSLISRSCFSEKTGMQRRRRVGGAI
jgi:hypothetical protein